MPIALQAKLLRVIQEKRVMPIGSSQEVPVDVRIIATTNRNMLEEVKLGRFREDLFYRLNVFPLNTLKLSNRKDDIPTIVANMLFNMDIDNETKTKISLDALNDLESYHWPGNVRELENVIQRHVALSEGDQIENLDIPRTSNTLSSVTTDESGAVEDSCKTISTSEVNFPDSGCNLEKRLESYEKDLILQALKRCQGNQTRAADLLQISYRQFRYRAGKLDLQIKSTEFA